MKYGMDEGKVISWKAWHAACVEYWTNILGIDDSKAFTCTNCGPRPNYLVVDGITMGIQTSVFNKYRDQMTTTTPHVSNATLEGSKFEDRMFIKKSSNRKILREAAKNCIWPVLTGKDVENDPEFEVGVKRKRDDSSDEGMLKFKTLMSKTDQTKPPTKGFRSILYNLSSSSSTVALLQVIDKPLIEQLIKYLKGVPGYNFVKGTENLEILMKLRTSYPVLTEIILNLADGDGQLERPLRFGFHSSYHTLQLLAPFHQTPPNHLEGFTDSSATDILATQHFGSTKF